jgi:hypothetical protein
VRRTSGRAKRLRLLVAVATALVAVAIAVFAYARIPTSQGVITACVARDGGVRFVDTDRGQRCRRGERRVRFNQRGRRGPRGLPGSPGAAGAQGLEGAQGTAGAASAGGAAGAPGRDAGTIVDGGGCSAIQSAIDGLPATGGAVLVRPGVFTCGAPIVIDRDHVALRGSGPATVLKLGDHGNRPVIVIGQTIENPTTTRHDVAVSDLSIDGNRAQQDYECSNGACAGGDFLRNNGLSLRRVEDVVVERVSVTGARSGGLVSELGSRRLTVRDFTVADSAFDGLAGYQTEDSLFTGLHLHDNAGAGLSFDIDFNRNVIGDSVLEGNGDVGIFMRDSSDNLFSDLLIRESGSHGLFLAQVDADTTKPASGNTFTGMVVAGSGQDPMRGGHGMRVNDASCVDNLVVSTQFVGNRDGGLSEATPGLVQTSATITR